MKFAKIILVLLLFIPNAFAKKAPHISDILEGKVKDTSKASKKRIAEIDSRSKEARAQMEKKRKAAKLRLDRARKQYPEVESLYNSTHKAAEDSKGKGGKKMARILL